ncbi:MAG: glycosyltransferase family 4 protein [Bacteroidetes bacterium]|nr:glycosyltransferase family 4 protein [Bacteroidota bacterium]
MNKEGVSALKILILNYEYPPLGAGAGVITMFQARELAKQNKVTVVTSSENGTFSEEQESENLKVIRLNVRRRHQFKSNYQEKTDWIKKGYEFFKQHEKIDFDVCIAHFSIPGGALAYYLKRRFGLKYTIVSHGHDIPWFCRHQMFWPHLFLFPLIKFIVNHSERLFVQSDEMYKNATKFLGHTSSKVVQVPNGCDSSSFGINPNMLVDKNQLEILFIGRLAKQKQPLQLIEIAKELIRRNISFNIKVAGDGPLKQELMEKIKDSGLEGYISTLGWLDKPQVLELYQNANILLAPTIEEGMSIAIMEALFSGVFVITRAVSGIPELLQQGKTGFICDGSSNGFADGIELYLKNREEIFHNKEKLVEEFKLKYNWENIVEKYQKELADVVS